MTFTFDKVHIKRDCTEGSMVYGIRQPISFTSTLDKASWFKVVCETEIRHYEKIKTTLNNITIKLKNEKKTVVLMVKLYEWKLSY